MIPDHVYHGMLPALRLATTMLEISSLSLTTYAEIGFFADAEPPKIMIFEKAMNPIPTKQENTTMNLQRSPNITTCLLVLPSTSLKRYGITRVVADTTFPVLSCLASKFFQTLESPIYGTLSASALNRKSFMLAVTCVHEAVHAVFYSSDLVESVGRGGQGEAMVPEPILEDFDPEAELGCALEYYFFGGRLEFNGLPSDISGGVGVIWKL